MNTNALGSVDMTNHGVTNHCLNDWWRWQPNYTYVGHPVPDHTVLLRELVTGLDEAFADPATMPDTLWQAYAKAKVALGQPVPRQRETVPNG